jgi:hypothetical protein
MERFIEKHADAVIGTLSGMDRWVLRGTLRPLSHVGGMMSYLWAAKVRLKDFGDHALRLSKRLIGASEETAAQASRPFLYLPSSSTSKEETARKIAEEDGIKDGLVCVLRAVEPCMSYSVVGNRATEKIELKPDQRKCLHLYHYMIHPVFGFMNARIQTWFPFSVQICINGREWLARQMTEENLGFIKRDNCFTWLEDPLRAQALMDRQLQTAWPELLSGIARALNPLHEAMFEAFPMDYYWSTFQSEWATDILFRDAETLGRLYPSLVHHGLTTFFSPDILRFLGRYVPPSGNIPPALKAEVTTDIKARTEGVRIKHRVGGNSVKMYDKQGSVLRVETTINDVAGFKSFRSPEGKPEVEKSWMPMRKGIADLHRRAEVSQAANDRYLDAMVSVENTTPLGKLVDSLCRPSVQNGRRFRAFNPHAPDDAKLIEAISRGEFTIAGFRNRDLRPLLFADAPASTSERRRQAAAISRKLALLRAHGLIRKVHGTHRYHLTKEGRTIVTALVTLRTTSTDSLTKLAA